MDGEGSEVAGSLVALWIWVYDSAQIFLFGTEVLRVPLNQCVSTPEEVRLVAPSQHPLRGLLLAQSAGAFNNSALKWFVALLAVEAVSAGQGLNGRDREALQQQQETIAFVVFTLPFVLVSLPAGF